MPATPAGALHVVIAGGGVAALETLMALHDQAEQRVRVTILAPEQDFELKQLRTAEPFSVDHVRRYALKDIAAEFGADLIRDEVREVDGAAHEIRCASGTTVEYDALVLTLGARPYAAYPQALTFGLEREPDALNGILADLEQGFTTSVAFVVPAGVSWPLPLYELALMTARHTFSMGIDDAKLILISPESAPLGIFGPAASDAVASLLSDAGVEFRPNAYASLAGGGEITLVPGGEHLRVGCTVSLPLLEGPRLAGVPCDEHGFIPVDTHGVVKDLPDVYAAGDATNFAVKQGGLACQQADAVAEHIAARTGALVDPQPFRPVLRGKLLTGAGAQYLRYGLHGGAGASTTSPLKLWSTPSKVAGRFLSEWLAGRDDADHPVEPVPAMVEQDVAVEAVKDVEVEVPLSPEWLVGYNPTGVDSLGVINPRGRHFASYGPFGN